MKNILRGKFCFTDKFVKRATISDFNFGIKLPIIIEDERGDDFGGYCYFTHEKGSLAFNIDLKGKGIHTEYCSNTDNFNVNSILESFSDCNLFKFKKDNTILVLNGVFEHEYVDEKVNRLIRKAYLSPYPKMIYSDLSKEREVVELSSTLIAYFLTVSDYKYEPNFKLIEDKFSCFQINLKSYLNLYGNIYLKSEQELNDIKNKIHFIKNKKEIKEFLLFNLACAFYDHKDKMIEKSNLKRILINYYEGN